MQVLSNRDFVVHFSNVLDADTCREIIAAFDRSPDVHDGRVLHMDHGHQQNEEKVSFDLAIPVDGDWTSLHEKIHVAVSRAVGEILALYPALQVDPLGSTGYKIQRYRKNEGHFAWHVDSFGSLAETRLLALILYLNDVAEGGETEFHHQARSVVPRAGEAIFFPTAWTHMHRGTVPHSGDKYVISSFFRFPPAE